MPDRKCVAPGCKAAALPKRLYCRIHATPDRASGTSKRGRKVAAKKAARKKR